MQGDNMTFIIYYYDFQLFYYSGMNSVPCFFVTGNSTHKNHRINRLYWCNCLFLHTPGTGI